MDRDRLIDLCLRQPHAVEDYPFGEEVAVFKVAGKMFALVPLDANPARVTLKCEPVLAIELRERHHAVAPGYHTDKRHWNTVTLDGTIGDADLTHMVTHSYEQVVAKLTKAQRVALGATSSDRAATPEAGRLNV